MKLREDVLDIVMKRGEGVELGVAEGVFSEKALKKDVLRHLYSIDMWAGDRGHNVEQYKHTIRRLMPWRDSNTILKMRFDEALDLFDNESLDFIYSDGYAHDAQLGGKTLREWYPKLKQGGIMSGDDYHEHHPENVAAINAFVNECGGFLQVINCHEPYTVWSEYPTWYFKKPLSADFLNGKRVAVVGNAASLFEQSYGAEIDDHDIIIRMNRHAEAFGAAPADIIRSCGMRTSIWAVWRADEYFHTKVEAPIIIQMAPWQGIYQYQPMSHKELHVYSYKHSLELVDKLCQYGDIIKKHRIPSTGIMVLDWLSRAAPAEVNVYGFDWKVTPTWTDPDRTIDKYVAHDWAAEKAYCMKLAKERNFNFHHADFNNIEQVKYEKMWSDPRYRAMSPGEHLVDTFISVVAPTNTIIDFGCGTGRAAKNIAEKTGNKVILLDFASNCRDTDCMHLPFVEWDLTKPLTISAPYGYCTDVMEHIPPSDVKTVISNIMNAATVVFFQISTVPDQFGKLIGTPLHLSVHPHEWWRNLFNELGYSVTWESNHEAASLFCVVNQKSS